MEKDITLAALGLAATTVAALIWVVKYFAQTLSEDLREHTKAATELTNAAKQQTKASLTAAKSNDQVLTFMKKLNGKLEGAVQDKLNETK